MIERSKSLWQFLCVGIFSLIIIGLNHMLMPSYMGDDVYIHCTYIRTIIETGTFGYNTSVPTYGSSSIAWVLVGSLFSLFTQEVPTTLRVVSAVLFVINSLLVLSYISTRFDLPGWQTFLFFLIYMVNAVVFRWMLTGMETNLVLFASIGILTWYKPERPVLSAVFCLLAYLVRPEFILLPASYFLVYLPEWKKYAKEILQFSVSVLILFVVLFSFCYWYFGSIGPLTAIKSGSGADVESLIRFVKVVVGTYPVELILIGVLSLLAGSPRRVYQSLNQGERLLIVFMILILFLYAVKGTSVLSRYLTLIHLPVMILLISLASKRIRTQWLVFAALSILITQTTIFYKVHYPAVREFVSGFQSTYTQIGKMLRTRSADDTRSIMVSDIGIIGFYSQRPIIDLGGLTSTHVYETDSFDASVIMDKYHPAYGVLRLKVDEADEAIRKFIDHSHDIRNFKILLQQEIGSLGTLDANRWIVYVMDLYYESEGPSQNSGSAPTSTWYHPI